MTSTEREQKIENLQLAAMLAPDGTLIPLEERGQKVTRFEISALRLEQAGLDSLAKTVLLARDQLLSREAQFEADKDSILRETVVLESYATLVQRVQQAHVDFRIFSERLEGFFGADYVAEVARQSVMEWRRFPELMGQISVIDAMRAHRAELLEHFKRLTIIEAEAALEKFVETNRVILDKHRVLPK